MFWPTNPPNTFEGYTTLTLALTLSNEEEVNAWASTVEVFLPTTVPATAVSFNFNVADLISILSISASAEEMTASEVVKFYHNNLKETAEKHESYAGNQS